MSSTAPRAKPKGGRRKTVRAPSHAELVEEIFTDLPAAVVASAAVPEVVRAKRRERAMRRVVDALDLRGDHPLPEARRVELRRMAERWARKGFDAAFPEVDELELRCAEEREELEAATPQGRFEAAKRRYLGEVLRRHGKIEIRGLQVSEQVRQDLEVAYVPLFVEDPSAARPVAQPAKRKSENDATLDAMLALARSLERPRVRATQALDKHQRCYLIGSPGSGKSTLASWLATRAARGIGDPDALWLADAVPFVIPVRSLRNASQKSLAAAACVEPWLMDEALRRGRALFLVDGLDEADSVLSEAILDALTSLLQLHSTARALVTTRPSTLAGGEGPIPAGFSAVRLTSMAVSEVHGFIDKWCLAAELSMSKAREQAEVEAQLAAQDLKQRVRLRSAIEKLAQTPLLCSVICIVHRFQGHQIPERRIALYEAITNALLYEWDKAKFPGRETAVGRLDAQQKRLLLSRLARTMHEAGAAEWSEAEVIKTFAEHLPNMAACPAQEAPALVAEIRDRSGVLVERRPGVFAFSHLTFQEYLAAMAFVSNGSYDHLLRNRNDPWWHEVIALAAGIPGADSRRIVARLLQSDKKDVGSGTLLAAQCAETAIELPADLRREIDLRVASLIPPRSHEHHERIAGLGDLAGPPLLHGINRADAAGKATIFFALGRIGYAPAASVLIKFLADGTRVGRAFPGSYNTEFTEYMSLAACAMTALSDLMSRSEGVFSQVLEAIPSAHPEAIWAVRALLKGEPPGQERDRLNLLLRAHATARSVARGSPRRRAARSG